MTDEQKANTQVTTTGTATNTNNGLPDQTTGLLESARQIAERIERANVEHKLLLDREEQIRAKDLLSGRSSAGYSAPIVDEETKRIQALNEALKGTGIKI